jgi:hypothetical protein
VNSGVVRFVFNREEFDYVCPLRGSAALTSITRVANTSKRILLETGDGDGTAIMRHAAADDGRR